MGKVKVDTLRFDDINVLPDINTKYAYVLAQENEPRGRVYDETGAPRGEVKYKPYMNALLRSSINWDGTADPYSGKPRSAGRHLIRYYDGCTTLFMDDQPKDKETIEQLIQGTRDVVFAHGYYFVYGYDSMLKTYLDWASYNENSEYRIPTVPVKWKMVDTEKNSENDSLLLELEDKARDLAKSATYKKMLMHGRYLGIQQVDDITGQPLSEKVFRIEYRKFAKNSPKHFVTSYNDKSIEVATWITDAIDTGKISTSKLPNHAIWSKGESVIMELGGLKSADLIVNKLAEFTLLEEGADFLEQLRALYS